MIEYVPTFNAVLLLVRPIVSPSISIVARVGELSTVSTPVFLTDWFEKSILQPLAYRYIAYVPVYIERVSMIDVSIGRRFFCFFDFIVC